MTTSTYSYHCAHHYVHYCLCSQVIAIVDTNHDGKISITELMRSAPLMKNKESAAARQKAHAEQQARDAQQADEDLTDEDTCV